MQILISESKTLKKKEVIDLYTLNKWTAAEKPTELFNALLNSHTLITAWHNDKLIGLGNAISDGYLVVYYPHLLVLPKYQGKGVGKMIVDKLREKYKDFHMQMLTADGKSIDFYRKTGFEKAGETMSMWIYNGKDH